MALPDRFIKDICFFKDLNDGEWIATISFRYIGSGDNSWFERGKSKKEAEAKLISNFNLSVSSINKTFRTYLVPYKKLDADWQLQ